MTIMPSRRPTAFMRAVLEMRAGHLKSLLEQLSDADINSAQDFHMLLDIALNSGIRQCDIARTLETRRNKLSSWSNRISVARAPSERQRIANAIRALLEKKLSDVNQLIVLGHPSKPSHRFDVPRTDIIP
ncbi:hypothetical protein [Hyphomicrobium sp.]|uniref:hypothetical protein n=1 Tax=Hyphomicrobium sp. TaxID=82 RepID=UPI002E2FFDD8|nr:hypothetical protein [Hyphomicrobium sp.]HEX2841270.1 hypothetical protein [Hyphomicrobium sp.]